MTREIKFRAWNTTGKMWQTEYCAIGMNGEKLILLFEGEFVESKDVAIIFSQFTGLLDKNGKEIYEGDICNFPSYEEGIRTTTVKDAMRDYHFLNKLYSLEVVGNIYQNPELIK